jgi:NADH-quinone oxidoreductase subunit L
MSVGLAGEQQAMFHLTTHAFFKALLFLGAGSVIHALHEEQDIWKMGGLIKKMPITFWTFLFGTLALSGVFPFSGFYSKDSILAQAMHVASVSPVLGYTLFGLGAAVAGLTTFYMFRLFFVAFLGNERTEKAKHAHESPIVMTGPLMILAVFSIIGGFIGILANYAAQFANLTEKPSFMEQFMEPFHTPIAACFSIGMVAVGFIAAWVLYGKGTATDPLPAKLGGLATAMNRKFYFDELYEATFIRAHDMIAAIMNGIDHYLLEGLCIGIIRGGTDLTGRGLRRLQTGSLQTYAFLFVLGVVLLLYFALGK